MAISFTSRILCRSQELHEHLVRTVNYNPVWKCYFLSQSRMRHSASLPGDQSLGGRSEHVAGMPTVGMKDARGTFPSSVAACSSLCAFMLF